MAMVAPKRSDLHLERSKVNVEDTLTVCGADYSPIRLTRIKENVTCQCCLGNHRWTTVRTPSTPDGPSEAIEVCVDCGRENVNGSWVEGISDG